MHRLGRPSLQTSAGPSRRHRTIRLSSDLSEGTALAWHGHLRSEPAAAPSPWSWWPTGVGGGSAGLCRRRCRRRRRPADLRWGLRGPWSVVCGPWSVVRRPTAAVRDTTVPPVQRPPTGRRWWAVVPSGAEWWSIVEGLQTGMVAYCSPLAARWISTATHPTGGRRFTAWWRDDAVRWSVSMWRPWIVSSCLNCWCGPGTVWWAAVPTSVDR